MKSKFDKIFSRIVMECKLQKSIKKHLLKEEVDLSFVDQIEQREIKNIENFLNNEEIIKKADAILAKTINLDDEEYEQVQVEVYSGLLFPYECLKFISFLKQNMSDEQRIQIQKCILEYGAYELSKKCTSRMWCKKNIGNTVRPYAITDPKLSEYNLAVKKYKGLIDYDDQYFDDPDGDSEETSQIIKAFGYEEINDDYDDAGEDEEQKNEVIKNILNIKRELIILIHHIFQLNRKNKQFMIL